MAADVMEGGYLGPAITQPIGARLHAAGARFTVLSRRGRDRDDRAALADGDAVGWLQGRMEFGPRALGARSMLGDPRSPDAEALNLRVKYRESFRPFAPSVLREDVADWFELDADIALHAAGRRREARRAADDR